MGSNSNQRPDAAISDVVRGYALWRAWGHRSRLGEIVCGPSGTQKQAEQTQIQASQQQMQTAEEQTQLSREQFEKYKTDIQPLETKLTALSGGDRNLALSAAMPVISQVSGGYDAAKQRIMDTIPPGVARDTALANLEVTKATTTGGAMAAEVEKAPQELAALGAGIGSFSLQELGAALSGFSGASQSAGAVAQEENAAQQNKLGLWGSLAGAAGTGLSAFKLPSDLKLKKNIAPIGPVLDKIRRSRIVRFDYRSGRSDQIGVIAQEIRLLFPECVESMPDGTLIVDYGMLASVALAGIKELTGRVAELERKEKEMAVAG